MKRRRETARIVRSTVGIAFVLATLVVVAVTSGHAQDKKEIVIGYSISETGRFSTEALDVRRGYELWRDEINAAGGIVVKDLGRKLPVRFIMYDDKSDASTAAKLYERLITADKVDLVLGPWGSGINFAISAITEKHGYPAILTSASSDAIYARGFKRIFLAAELASRDAIPIAEYLKSNDKIKTVAVIYENFIFAESVFNSFMKLLESNTPRPGPKVVLTEKYPLGGQSFLGLLTKVKGANPDAVIVFNIMPSSIYVTRQMREVGLVPNFYYVLIGPMYKEYMEGIGPLAEGVAEHGFWHPELPYAGVKEFAQAFEKRYSRTPTPDAAHAYIATAVLTQAIEKAGTLNHDRLAEVMHREEFRTVGGVYKYDEAGRNVLEKQFMVQVLDSKRTIVWPKELARGLLRFPASAR